MCLELPKNHRFNIRQQFKLIHQTLKNVPSFCWPLTCGMAFGLVEPLDFFAMTGCISAFLFNVVSFMFESVDCDVVLRDDVLPLLDTDSFLPSFCCSCCCTLFSWSLLDSNGLFVPFGLRGAFLQKHEKHQLLCYNVCKNSWASIKISLVGSFGEFYKHSEVASYKANIDKLIKHSFRGSQNVLCKYSDTWMKYCCSER